MRTSRPALLLCLCWLIPVSVSAQQSASAGSTSGSQSSPGTTLLQQSLTALTGGAQVTAVTLTGTATATAGPNRGTGPIVLVATADGRSQIIFNSPAGTTGSVSEYSSSSRAGTFSGIDGTSHAVPANGVLGPHPAWFFPAFLVGAGLSSQDYVSADIGHEIRNDVAVEHVVLWRPNASATWSVTGQQSQDDLYLDSSSSMPVALTFTVLLFNPQTGQPVRPDVRTKDRELQEVRYSAYRQVQGVPVPFRIQVYVHGTLVTDIQLSSVAFNTGVTIAAVN